MRRSAGLGYAFVSLAAILWGIVGLAARFVYASGASPLTYAVFRSCMSAIVLAVALGLFRPGLVRIDLRDIGFFALFGVVSIGIFYFSLFYAIQATSVTVAWILLYTAPAYVMVLSAAFLHERITRVKGLSLVLTVVGSALVSGIYHLSAAGTSVLGILAGLSSGLTYALYSLFGRKALARYGPWTTLLYSFGFGGLVLLIAWLPTARAQAPVVLKLWPLFLATALFATVTPYCLYLFGLTMVETSKASTTANLEPVTAVALAHFYLGEHVTAPQLVGAVLVLGGVMAVQVTDLLAAGRARARRGTGEEGVNS